MHERPQTPKYIYFKIWLSVNQMFTKYANIFVNCRQFDFDALLAEGQLLRDKPTIKRRKFLKC
jgi:hypothetical protein